MLLCNTNGSGCGYNHEYYYTLNMVCNKDKKDKIFDDTISTAKLPLEEIKVKIK